MKKYILPMFFSMFMLVVLAEHGTVKPNPTPMDFIVFFVLVFGVPLFSAHLAFRNSASLKTEEETKDG